tara:strand:- start:46 stop:396 length:351 start_codon:yes stop_codon:yes gene_type:complete
MYAITDNISGYVIKIVSTREAVNKYPGYATGYHLIADYPDGLTLAHMFDPLTKSFSMKSWREIKLTRDATLQESDWRVLPNYPGSDQAAWITYRQKLRDLPQDYTEVADIVFPTEP